MLKFSVEESESRKHVTEFDNSFNNCNAAGENYVENYVALKVVLCNIQVPRDMLT